MVRVTAEDLPAEDQGLLEFLSESDSNSDIEDVEAENVNRYQDIVPLIPFNTSFPNVVIIAGLPCVSEDRYEKLKVAVTRRIYKELTQRQVLNLNAETKLNPDGTLPFATEFPTVTDSSGATVSTGVCFVTFKESFDATKAARILNNVGLDHRYPFRVCRLDDFDLAIGEDTEVDTPITVGFPRSNFRDWLCDPLGREQYAYRCGTTSETMWHDAIERTPESICPHDDKLGTALCWSPMGSYLVTFHKRGIWLRADNDFKKKISFTHSSAKYILFSPNEEYLITWDGTNPQPHHDQAVIVWQVFTGRKLRTFPTPQYSTNGVRTSEGGLWPFFLFSPDSKYLAMREEKDIVIYETSTMLLLEEPTADASGKRNRSVLNYPCEQFQWSPSSNTLSIWIPEYNDAPGRLLLVDIPSRQEISSKNVFSVKSVSMHWHPTGEFLALCTVIARKKGKKTKKETTQIEIFRVKEKSIPVDTINIEEARVKSLHWELGQNAGRFAILTVSETSGVQTIQFYHVPTKGMKRDTELVETLPVPHSINTVEWSPAGQYFVAACKSSDGTLLFGCLNDANKAEIIQRDEHFDLTDVLWDPSGRYVTTAVLIPSGMNSYRITCNAGFRIYSFLGKLQHRVNNEACAQFLWRPRPAPLLTAEKMEDIHKKLREYSKKYDAQDEMRRQARNAALREESSGKLAQFMEKWQAARSWAKQHPLADEWNECSKKLANKLQWYEKPTTWEEVIEVIREPVKRTEN